MNARFLSLLGLAAAVALVVGAPAAAQAPKEDFNVTPPEPDIQKPFPPVNGFIVVDDSLWTAQFSGEPERYFKEALGHFDKGSMDGVARSLDKAASHTRAFASRAKGDPRVALDASIRRLEEISKELRHKEPVAVDDLTVAFAENQRALSRQHAEMARQAYQARHPGKAGVDERAAVEDLRNALAWENHKPDESEEARLVEAEYVANALSDNVGFDAERARRALDDLVLMTWEAPKAEEAIVH